MKKIMDGNEACSRVSYKFTETSAIYPITPSSPIAENIEKMSVKGEKNFFGNKVKVVEMQSEAGAIGALHGMLQNGVFSSTYTASQGLLLMIPNMYKIAGENLPCVIDVAARTVSTHALSIMGDHSDIYAARSTGFAFICSSKVADIEAITSIAHLSTIKGKVPFVNFFDGFRTSHEINKVELLDLEEVEKLIDQKSVDEFRKHSLDIDNPSTRGTNQSDSIFFENSEARNKYYNNLPDIVNDYMERINKITGKDLKPFNYYGDKNATKVIVAMGSVCETIKEYIDKNDNLDKIGLIEVHLFRPFSKSYFLKALPETTKTIAVLDRAKDPAAGREPLCLDVTDIVKTYDLDINVIGGRYGLSSKDTTLNDIEAVYNNMNKETTKEFTIGINDDVTDLSLEKTKTKFSNNYLEMLIYGYGSDGMVTTSKDILTIIGDETDKYVQGYFEYDSRKSGGLTKSHLRFSLEPISSPYYVTNPKIVVCSKDTYISKYKMLDNIKENGLFILNTEKDKLELPKDYLDIIKTRNIKVFTIDASKIARDNNIPNKISMIMENVILSLSNLIDKKTVVEYISEMIHKNFDKKGKSVVDSNINAIKSATENIKEINIDEIDSYELLNENNTLYDLLESDKKDEIKVSQFIGHEDGVFTKEEKEKHEISNITPSYDKEKCIMCNMCSLVCPHAVIRPYLLTKEEYDNAPEEVKQDAKEAKIKDNELMFEIGISTFNCTGCSLCTSICPTGAIKMEKLKEKEKIKYEYLKNIKDKEVMPKSTIKGLGFVNPSFTFPGACAGCGETPYLKILSQLFKDNLIIANATGCSSIYGGQLPSVPWNNPWVNSLFEDNAEFGYGIRLSEDYMKNKIRTIMVNNYDKVNDHNKELFNLYLNNYSKEVSINVYNMLDYDNIKELIPYKKYIKEKSIWAVGGDGWAYDIGFSGIDHVISNNENINILVLDTEVYSNTGGQSSKSSRPGQVAKFNTEGKQTSKKNLAKIAMCYPNCYVGTVSLGANPMHTIKTLLEAEQYDGPSIIICYAPCIAHGIKTGMKDSLTEEKLATISGYFPLMRYNPETKKITLDSGAEFDKIDDLFNRENRFRSSEKLLEKSKKDIKDNYEYLKELSEK